MEEKTVGRRKLQLAELSILKETVALIEEAGLRYVALGGTLLGAVRHRGFIPWDDDVDIGMPRPDYDRFCLIANERFGEGSPIRFLSFATTEGYPYYFSRVTDERVKVVDRSAKVAKVQPAWIDVFPIDGIPGGIKGKIHKLCLLKARMEFQYSQFDELVNVRTKNRPLHERILIGFGKVFPVQKLFKKEKCLQKLDKLLRKYDFATSPYAVNFMGAGKFREMHERAVYETYAEYAFEDTTIKSVKDADRWLTQMYGDYRTPPPDDAKNKHFTEVIEENDVE